MGCVVNKYHSDKAIHMISEKKAINRVESKAQRLGRFVLIELPATQLLVLASAVSILWASTLSNLSFVLGQHAFLAIPSRHHRPLAARHGASARRLFNISCRARGICHCSTPQPEWSTRLAQTIGYCYEV